MSRLKPMFLASAIKARPHINSFPDEVLTTVFEFVLFDDSDSSNTSPTVLQIKRALPSQFVLMGVCKHWKTLCVSTPSWWNNLTIDIQPAKVIKSDSLIWNQFAIACKKVLEWSGRLPLTLRLKGWHLNNDTIRTVSRLEPDELVIDVSELAYRVLQLAIEQCTRWKAFELVGRAPESSAAVPWAQLMKVAHRIPLLEKIEFDKFRWIPPPLALPPGIPLPIIPRPGHTDLFLDAPRLSAATLGFRGINLDLRWSQLKEIAIMVSGFDSHRQFVDYFCRVMTRTTAHTVRWFNDKDFLEDVDGICPTLPTIENPHITYLRLACVVLPPMRLPNLTVLNFDVGQIKNGDVLGVAPIVSLLKNSGCRLQKLVVFDWSGVGGHVLVPLLPYLKDLEKLTLIAIAKDERTVNRVVGCLGALLAEHTNLPKLTSLTVNIDNVGTLGGTGISRRRASFDGDLAKAVWNIVHQRMVKSTEIQLGWRGVTLERFHINVVCNGKKVKESSSQGFVNSSAWKAIQAANLNVEIRPLPLYDRPPVGDHQSS
ncbi:hypothetical protein CYLTODRAFT_490990 [Cylindrobasidium torrendii FP15055 ss-10]|uniref:F-box domain-containing protein n=1 Tax=Cylindrobasidium torrendii FP15055 ss-10 TaxID=1314674 RepID=A0A0D7B9W6_9AGAR|nr:hypothetical protein CYLTODRAFT_490990 [Cylindrobasidium torrendii FP15055 ss-10]